MDIVLQFELILRAMTPIFTASAIAKVTYGTGSDHFIGIVAPKLLAEDRQQLVTIFETLHLKP